MTDLNFVKEKKKTIFLPLKVGSNPKTCRDPAFELSHLPFHKILLQCK